MVVVLLDKTKGRMTVWGCDQLLVLMPVRQEPCRSQFWALSYLFIFLLSADRRETSFAFMTNNKSIINRLSGGARFYGRKLSPRSHGRTVFEKKKKKSLPIVSLSKLLSPVFNTAGIWSHEQSDYTYWAM